MTGAPALRVVIYGEHSPDWMTAFAPNAAVWRMAGVDKVLIVADAPRVTVPGPWRKGIRTVMIPLMEDHARHCPPQYPTLTPDAEAIDTLSNKAAFAAYTNAHGLAHLGPAIYASADAAAFPCVLKRTDLNSGRGVAIMRSRAELEMRLEQEPWRGHPVLLQALARGATEYVTHCVCQNGRILWHASYAHDWPSDDTIQTPDRAVPTRRISASRHVLSQIESLLLPLAYRGPCSVDYKLSERGDVVVFEINPRLGGSLMRPENTDALAGALACIVQAALGERGVSSAR